MLIEILNQFAACNRQLPGRGARPGVAASVLRLLGGVPLAEKRMIGEVPTLDQRTVSDVVTPRSDVTWLDAAKPPVDALARLRASPHREFPVGRGFNERVLGLVRKEDLFTQWVDGTPISLERVLHLAPHVREDAPVLDVVSLFRREPAEMTVVVDAAGLFRGVVTRKDLLEAFAGDMPDSG